jgi:hypothetical protein
VLPHVFQLFYFALINHEALFLEFVVLSVRSLFPEVLAPRLLGMKFWLVVHEVLAAMNS